jgi:hypothetical protein
MSKWRRSTWVLIAIVTFWAALFVIWLVLPDPGTDEAAVLTARVVRFAICTIGFSFSVVLWGMYRWFAIQSRSEDR